jgi:hypothetical protein
MRRTHRLALTAVAALSALGFAGSAFASFAPKLIVASSGTGGTVRLGVVASNTDDATARVAIYAPAGYQFATPVAGTKLGDVTATASSNLLAGAVVPLTGELDAIAPTAATSATATTCGVSPSQTWDLHLTAGGQVIDIPLFVVAGTTAESGAGFPTKLVVCLAPPAVSTANPTGAKLLSATFGVSAITQPVATGDYRWTSQFTPFNANGTPNLAGTVETQAIQHLPTERLAQTVSKAKLTTFVTKRIHGKKHRVKVVRTRVKFSASVIASGTAPTSTTISTTAAGKRVGGATGSFILAAGKSASVTSTALVNNGATVPTLAAASATDLFYAELGATACTPTTILGGLPCVDATVGGATIKASKTVVAYRR